MCFGQERRRWPSPVYTREQSDPPQFVRWWETDHYTCYEQAAACSEGLQEWTNYGWRFCFVPEARQESGISWVWLAANDIHVRTATPAVVPPEVEGLPIPQLLPLAGLEGHDLIWD